MLANRNKEASLRNRLSRSRKEQANEVLDEQPLTSSSTSTSHQLIVRLPAVQARVVAFSVGGNGVWSDVWGDARWSRRICDGVEGVSIEPSKFPSRSAEGAVRQSLVLGVALVCIGNFH